MHRNVSSNEIHPPDVSIQVQPAGNHLAARQYSTVHTHQLLLQQPNPTINLSSSQPGHSPRLPRLRNFALESMPVTLGGDTPPEIQSPQVRNKSMPRSEELPRSRSVNYLDSLHSSHSSDSPKRSFSYSPHLPRSQYSHHLPHPNQVSYSDQRNNYSPPYALSTPYVSQPQPHLSYHHQQQQYHQHQHQHPHHHQHHHQQNSNQQLQAQNQQSPIHQSPLSHRAAYQAPTAAPPQHLPLLPLQIPPPPPMSQQMQAQQHLQHYRESQKLLRQQQKLQKQQQMQRQQKIRMQQQYQQQQQQQQQQQHHVPIHQILHSPRGPRAKAEEYAPKQRDPLSRTSSLKSAGPTSSSDDLLSVQTVYRRLEGNNETSSLAGSLKRKERRKSSPSPANEPGVVTRMSSALATKVIEVSEQAGNFLQAKMTGIERFWSPQTTSLHGILPPPDCWSPGLSVLSHLGEEKSEQLFYLFQSLKITPTHLPAEYLPRLLLLFPPTISLSIQCAIGILFTPPTLSGFTFEFFLDRLSLMQSGLVQIKLELVYQVLLGLQTLLSDNVSMGGRLSSILSDSGKLKSVELSKKNMQEGCLTIARDLHNLGFVTKQYVAFVFSEISTCFYDVGSEDDISEEAFLTRTENSTLFIFCFELMQFICKYTVDKIQLCYEVVCQNKPLPSMQAGSVVPRKEGFLNKQWKLGGGYQKFKYHWCLAYNGTFGYYDDLVQYKAPERVFSLVNAIVRKIKTKENDYDGGSSIVNWDQKQEEKEEEDFLESEWEKIKVDAYNLLECQEEEINMKNHENHKKHENNEKHDSYENNEQNPEEAREHARERAMKKLVEEARNANEKRAMVSAQPSQTVQYGFELSVPPQYRRKFLCGSKLEALSWVNIINFYSLAPQRHRFGSSFPVHYNVSGRALVDGKATFTQILIALHNAKREIFISDWFFSCELLLVRGTGGNSSDGRLDKILLAKASKGVMVYILLWNCTKVISLASAHVRESMESLHPNIKVILHPLHMPVKWSHHQKLVVVDQHYAYVGGFDLGFGRYDDENHSLFDPTGNIWPGKDYYNPSFSPFEKLDEPFEDAFNRKKLPRMGWHDVHFMVVGDAARDLALNFIERWNYSKEDMERYNCPFLLPRTDKDMDALSGHLTVQVIRSLGSWHLSNLVVPETSIYTAYLHYIENAEHYIYIENQYFISSLAGSPVQNRVAEAIANRIAQAIRESQVFRVYIILPLYPEGSFVADASIRSIMNWQYKTINRGDGSLFQRLQSEFPTADLEEYISFYSLRKFQEKPGKLHQFATEQIYVHSKIMIVDDKVAIIGSANINDRSLLGDRDSELACVIEDSKTKETTMNGESYTASCFAYNLRKTLWREHLGRHKFSRDKKMLNDPTHPNTYNLWTHTARLNTEVFRQAFPGIPDNKIQHLHQVVHLPKMTPGCQVLLSRHVRGNIVNFPLLFLQETLAGTIDNFTPEDVFT